MPSQIERMPDELWTSYLARRLRELGMNFSDFRATDASNSLFQKGDLSFSMYSIADLTADGSRNIELSRVLCYPYSPPIESTLAQHIGLLTIREVVLVPLIGTEGEDILFEFETDGTSELGSYSYKHPPEPFTKYKIGESYGAEEVIDDIVQYATEQKPQSGFPNIDKAHEEERDISNLLSRYRIPETPPQQTTGQKPQSADTSILERILRTVERIDQRSAQHPLILQDEHHYLTELYVRAIKDNPDNLQVFEYEGQRIPYVLVHSSDIGGNVGKPSNKLYFVARDIATEPWQQQIVAYHESLCVREGHEEAKKGELPLARFLGKEEEYLEWRKKIDNGGF